MANPICLSPLKFYDDIAKQSHRKTYAHGHISPLLTKIYKLPSFQFIIPDFLYNAGGALSSAILYDAKTDAAVGSNRSTALINGGFSISTHEGFKLAQYKSNGNIFTDVSEGLYYLKLASANDTWCYYSVFYVKISCCIPVFYFNEVLCYICKTKYF